MLDSRLASCHLRTFIVFYRFSQISCFRWIAGLARLARLARLVGFAGLAGLARLAGRSALLLGLGARRLEAWSPTRSTLGEFGGYLCITGVRQGDVGEV